MFNTGKDKEVKTVYQTNDYDKFVFSKSNRNAELSQVLMEEIKKIGQVSPIVVNQQNGIVIEGQHRLLALKELNYPVQYIFTENDIETLPDTNAGCDMDRLIDALDKFDAVHELKKRRPATVSYIEIFRDAYNKNRSRNLMRLSYKSQSTIDGVSFQ